jgi:hypothetical protein
MSLANLTASGWALLALTIGAWCCFVQDALRIARGNKPITDISPIAVGVFTAWLLWLVTP